MAHDVVDTQFAKEAEGGRLQWLELDYDQVQHEHYKQDYELVTSSVVVVRRAAGVDVAWQRLDDVWTFAHREPEFRTYVRDAIAASLAGRQE